MWGYAAVALIKDVNSWDPTVAVKSLFNTNFRKMRQMEGKMPARSRSGRKEDRPDENYFAVDSSYKAAPDHPLGKVYAFRMEQVRVRLTLTSWSLRRARRCPT